MITREYYIAKIRPFYESDLIKIITGIRRCGKSVILEQIKDEIGKSTDKIISMNFEDRRTAMQIKDGMSLISYIEDKRTCDEKYYLFFDEIQNIPGWQDACKTLRLENYSVFITGSNSKLLSREFTKELSGRYVSFRIRPFVYKEICEYCAELGTTPDITDYIIWGGFPKRFEFPDKTAQLQYLSDLDDTIIINDLINRYNIRKKELFTDLVNYVLRSNARIFSVNSVHTYIKQQNIECSVNTIIKYIGYLEEAYVIEPVKQYSTKTKKELAFYKKIYNEDVCFGSLRAEKNRPDLTHNFENIVYNELIYMGYDVMVYNDGKKKIDFIASMGGRQYYIQVAYSVADEKAYEREFSAFAGIDNLSQKIIITNDDYDYSTSAVRHIRFRDFILMEKL